MWQHGFFAVWKTKYLWVTEPQKPHVRMGDR